MSYLGGSTEIIVSALLWSIMGCFGRTFSKRAGTMVGGNVFLQSWESEGIGLFFCFSVLF